VAGWPQDQAAIWGAAQKLDHQAGQTAQARPTQSSPHYRYIILLAVPKGGNWHRLQPAAKPQKYAD
jgi:hypothetical protein